MKEADLIGWDWELTSGRLVAFPTGAAYAKYLLLFFFGPFLVLTILAWGGITPWGLQNLSNQRNADDASMTSDELAKIDRLKKSMLDKLKERLSDEEFKKFEQELEEKEAERARNYQEYRRKSSLVLWALIVLIGVVWAVLIFLGLILAFALIRLITAKYIFETTPAQELLVRVPNLLRNTTYRIPLSAIGDVHIKCFERRTGRYRIPALFWSVQISPRFGQLFDLPIFVVDDEPARSATGRPSDRAEDLQRKLKQLLGNPRPS